MTEAEVQRVIDSAASRGMKIDSYEASMFLGVKELLEREPTNERAGRVMAQYTALIMHGEPVEGFEQFLVGSQPFYTDEELERMAISKAKHLAYLARRNEA
jgi:hypothetical protein